MWVDKLKSLIPWHTSHRVNLDAKGVPQEIKVNVAGLPNIRNIGIDVHESTRLAWIRFLYSLSFLFLSLGVSLLVGALGQLVTLVQFAAISLFSAVILLTSTLTWMGWWNAIMILYLVVIEKSEHIQSCRCPYTPLKNGGRLPLCGKIWLGCLTLLGAQLISKSFSQVAGRFV